MVLKCADKHILCTVRLKLTPEKDEKSLALSRLELIALLSILNLVEFVVRVSYLTMSLVKLVKTSSSSALLLDADVDSSAAVAACAADRRGA